MGEPYAFLQKKIVPLAEAKIGIMTHAFNYGTACFEGIRGNWNPDHEQLYLFRARDHFRRLQDSAKILYMELPYSVDEMVEILLEVVRRGDWREDIYIRPMVYKSQEVVGVKLHNVTDDFLIFVTTLGAYLDFDAGVHCGTSSWRRVDDLGIPARAKVTGLYVNSALAKTEANLNGFDEAIMLTHDGHVSEGSGENIFLIRDGVLLTPPSSDNLLLGITRNTVMELACNEWNMPVIERQIDRSELYVADEVFMTGTAAHVSPIIKVDHRPLGDGQIGPMTKKIQHLYFQAAKGNVDRYVSWCTPVNVKTPQTAGARS
ncbi:MAG: branched-chain amino acid transaminase [Dehalococcoidia bacterium]